MIFSNLLLFLVINIWNGFSAYTDKNFLFIKIYILIIFQDSQCVGNGEEASLQRHCSNSHTG